MKIVSLKYFLPWSAEKKQFLEDFQSVSGEPVVVGVTMYILSISSVSEVMMVEIFCQSVSQSLAA